MAEELENRSELLFEESKKFSNEMGLPEDLILKIYKAETDWEFIIKIDAMLEAAVKSVVKKRLNRGSYDDEEKDSFDGFVDAMAMNGRVSLLSFLKVDGCPEEITRTIEAVRRLRNGFAHDIRLVDSTLIQIIKARPDKSHLIQSLSQMEQYREKELIGMYESDGGFLRFLILDATLRFLVIAYNS